MEAQNLKVILDTNLWLSLLIRGGFPEILKLIESNQIEILLSIELIDEFLEVSERPKFQKYFTKADRTAFLGFLLEKGRIVEVISKPKDCRDLNDNFLLALAIDGNATHLITGDQDLLVLDPYKKTRILKMPEFLKMFE